MQVAPGNGVDPRRSCREGLGLKQETEREPSLLAT